MIAGCIERMRQGACQGCARRDACAFLRRRPGPDGEPRRLEPERDGALRRHSGKQKFLAFLGAMASAIENRQKARSGPFEREIERRIEPLLETGEVRIERLARDLGLSRQTLYRRLKSEGTTFEQIVDRVRRRLALRLVREQKLPVKEAAWRLGFSDPAAFSRAFKRWTGLSPTAMQR